MPINELELLAPAGSMEALKAAYANGADAVYLGAASFGARSGAGFDDGTLEEALRLAHLHRKKIYVTVNILIKERELGDVRRTLSLLSSLGADAVLVQDLGVLKICREEFPALPVHASTQMAVHNASGVRLLKRLGARRAVLARECDLDAMAQAAREGLEIEAFCHGALCVSCSGQCLFSSMIGGRSGNRGRCAQPCRLPYAYQGEGGAWLSPRDLCARDELEAMAKAGVYSFKIEGRLKRPEYVAVVTRAYRRALDAILAGRFSPAGKEEKEELVQIFSRGGFTPGYPGKGRDAAIIDPSRVTPVGIFLGTVKRAYPKGGVWLADVLLDRSLNDGDGLEIGGQEARYSGPRVSAGQTATLRLREEARPGDAVRRTEDERQLAAARETYEGDALNRALPIPVDAALAAYPGKPLALTVSDGESAVSLQGEPCQAAQHKALDGDSARKSLEKTGGTPFVLRSLAVKTAGAFVPAAALNALRRQALEELARARIAAAPRQQAFPARFDAPGGYGAGPRLIVKTQSLSEVPSLLAAGADEALFQPGDWRKENLVPVLESALFRRLFSEKQLRLCLPGQLAQGDQDWLKDCVREAGIPVCLSSPGQLADFEGGAMAGEGIPVMNGETVRMLAYLGCKSVTLSRELSKRETRDLPADVCELILPVFGRARLMLLNHCPMRTKMGLSEGREACGLCGRGKGAAGTCLTDRKGAAYPLMPLRTEAGCQIGLMDSRPLDLSGHLGDMPPLSWLVVLTDEPQRDRPKIVSHFAALMKGAAAGLPEIRGTAGRFLDGVL